MIELLEPIAGSMAVAIFAIGIIAAGVSSQFPNVDTSKDLIEHLEKTC